MEKMLRELLEKVGFDSAEIERFLHFGEEGRQDGQIELLRRKRYSLLKAVHEKEHDIRKIDYLIGKITEQQKKLQKEESI